MPTYQLKALSQMGLREIALYTLYKVELKTGYFRWRKRSVKDYPDAKLAMAFPLPQVHELRKIIGEQGLANLHAEAEEILVGRIRLFGSKPVDLELLYPEHLRHWTEYEENRLEVGKDIKFIWEPGRFGWAIKLAQAYHLSLDVRFAEAFWNYTERFLAANPVDMGPHWISGQEVALRLISLFFAWRIFSNSSLTTPERSRSLAKALAEHAERIPLTLSYSQAQNNNHLLTESAGLLTASFALPAHPSASKWQHLGWKWFHQGIKSQIAEDGSYIQNSTNYHRLMLQISLWVYLMTHARGETFPAPILMRLAAATRWLFQLIDPESGSVPNLGPNDGAYIFPLTTLPIHDYRPIVQAAGLAFSGKCLLKDGPWNEMGLWLSPILPTDAYPTSEAGQEIPRSKQTQIEKYSPIILHSQKSASWAYLRVANFTARPGHADQLHLDLWWQGLNIAQDAGTYLYNASQPWDNSLTSTFVHNTVTINGQEQMLRAGRFLYLDWAQAKILSYECSDDGSILKVMAEHDGYRRLGIVHQRAIEAADQGWLIKDTLLPMKPEEESGVIQARLHWLLPDWEWKLQNAGTEIRLELQSAQGQINLKVKSPLADKISEPGSIYEVCLMRAGKQLAVYPLPLSDGKHSVSSEINPILGWISPTYGVKVPALSLSISVKRTLPLILTTYWELPED
jgi:hypothetical protein